MVIASYIFRAQSLTVGTCRNSETLHYNNANVKAADENKHFLTYLVWSRINGSTKLFSLIFKKNNIFCICR